MLEVKDDQPPYPTARRRFRNSRHCWRLSRPLKRLRFRMFRSNCCWWTSKWRCLRLHHLTLKRRFSGDASLLPRGIQEAGQTLVPCLPVRRPSARELRTVKTRHLVGAQLAAQRLDDLEASTHFENQIALWLGHVGSLEQTTRERVYELHLSCKC